MSHAIRAWAPLLVAFHASGCAALVCTPVTIIVTETEQRARLQDEIVGFRTNRSGRLEEIRRMEMIPEYWVRSTDGRWYRVTRDQYRAAVPGDAIEVCR
jgi:hypothetical protein